MSAPFVASQATVDVLVKAHEGANDLFRKAGHQYSAEFNSEYKQFALDVMKAATKIEKKELKLSTTVTHLLVSDVAGDGKCQLRALEVSQRPILPSERNKPFCQLNTTQLFGKEDTAQGQKFVTLEQENSIIGDRFRWVNEQYMPSQPHFEAIVTALVSEMQDLSNIFLDNLRENIRDLRTQIKNHPEQQQSLQARIGQIEQQIEQKQKEDAYLYSEKQDPKWFCDNRTKLDTGLEKILGNECGNFWFSLYNQALQFPIITFVQKVSGENHFIEFTKYLGAPVVPSEKQLACAVKVSGHWKSVMPLNDEQFRSLNEKGLIQRETQVFHARDGELNKWYLEGNLTGKTFHNETPPIGLTPELKRLCDSAHKGENPSKIEKYLREELKDLFIRFNLIPIDGSWVLNVTTQRGEFCLTSEPLIVNEAPGQQPAARPLAAGGGAAKPPVQPAARSVAQPSNKLKVDDPILIKILLRQSANSEALETYLKENIVGFKCHEFDSTRDGWKIVIYTESQETTYQVKNPTFATQHKAQVASGSPAATRRDEQKGGNCVIM